MFLGSNPCEENNGGCEELCLYTGNNQVTCACSHGQLAADNKTCEGLNADFYKDTILYTDCYKDTILFTNCYKDTILFLQFDFPDLSCLMLQTLYE